MGNVRVVAFYITICCIAFIISKIVVSVLLYRRWKRKNMVYSDGFPGGKIVMFRSPFMQSLTSDVLLKKTLKLSNKDIVGSGGFGTVYRLMINESTAFAVKRLHRGTAEMERGFEREVKAVVQNKREEYVLDTCLGGCPTDETNTVFSIALTCLEPEPSDRPTMAEVVKMLEKIKSEKVVKDN
ncbi:hypothetical protein Patl1_04976 [Pistacia atlantica]|uniref:Uncharacterized protein n=1 Tax=Pistacia atlantica TaxID=434234 RepID=A0ACC1BWY5_9ROSI|nr:hypothetical protein Patl1_04976 [Pistacia atlantica]